MPRTRKHRWWDLVITFGQPNARRTTKIRTHSKTYGGACHKAFKKLGIPKNKTDRETGGFENCHVQLAE